jgi:hypothetical protein
MAKRSGADKFEILVILAIVAIVAVTGQVLIFFQSNETQGSAPGTSITGFAISASPMPKAELQDISIEKIETNPASPLVGDPFEIKVFLKNKGNSEISTPFYVSVKFQPMEENSGLPPMDLQAVMPQILSPGEETAISLLATTIVPEGPIRLTAMADSTGKINDVNPADNQLSKTIIVATE